MIFDVLRADMQRPSNLDSCEPLCHLNENVSLLFREMHLHNAPTMVSLLLPELHPGLSNLLNRVTTDIETTRRAHAPSSRNIVELCGKLCPNYESVRQSLSGSPERTPAFATVGACRHLSPHHLPNILRCNRPSGRYSIVTWMTRAEAFRRTAGAEASAGTVEGISGPPSTMPELRQAPGVRAFCEFLHGLTGFAISEAACSNWMETDARFHQVGNSL
jgi:hypothetical protein